MEVTNLVFLELVVFLAGTNLYLLRLQACLAELECKVITILEGTADHRMENGLARSNVT